MFVITMYSFQHLRDYSKKVDEGIASLASRVQDPYKLSIVTHQSANGAKNLLESMYNDMAAMKVNIDSIIEERTDTEEAKEFCDEIQDFTKEIENELRIVELDLVQFGYEPLSKEQSYQIYETSIALDDNESSRMTKNGLDILEASPVFSSPNYNSTPESISCRRN